MQCIIVFTGCYQYRKCYSTAGYQVLFEVLDVKFGYLFHFTEHVKYVMQMAERKKTEYSC